MQMTCPRRPAIDCPQRDSPYLAAYRPTPVPHKGTSRDKRNINPALLPYWCKQSGQGSLRWRPDSSTYLEGIAFCRCRHRCKRDSKHDNQYERLWIETKSVLHCLHRPTMSLEYRRTFMSHQRTRVANGMQHVCPPSANYAVN